MEPVPSVTLLDIHCPQGALHEISIRALTDRVCSAFGEVVSLAEQAGDIRLEVDNKQEGLEATKSAYFALVGDEKTAKSLGDLGRLETWHGFARQRLEEWRENFDIPTGPELPTTPHLETDLLVGDYVPLNAVPEAVEKYRNAVRTAAERLVATVRGEVELRFKKVTILRGDIQASIGGERDVTQELADRAEEYRTRLSKLEQKASDLAELDKRIEDRLQAIDALIDQASNAWKDLRRERKASCKAVNESMPSFFVKLSENTLTDVIDKLLNELSTGTYLHEPSVRETRDALDRKSFVRAAIKYLQCPTSMDEREVVDDPSVNARKIAHIAMNRKKFDGIARLAVLWPGDGIEIFQKQEDDQPVPFDSLTEGLKALAIKEISFADSQLPAVTDQPEDAVPTTAIFENLVPTIRKQRVSRQFIIASHDANVVVSGDMERVIVLPPEPSEQPIVGTLFNASIRKRAIALLEGGDQAFELRRRRYGEYG